jgi:hypothetical protein
MNALKYTAVLLVTLLFSTGLKAQTVKQAKEAATKAMLENKNFTFVAQYANPLGGGHRYLNYDYDLRVRPDSVISYLPYFGTVQFAPPYNPTDDGIKFTSTKFGYQQVVKKKDKYVITITPKDAGYVQRLVLTTSTSGYANLQILITNRTAINFDGYITETPKKTDLAAK